MTTRQKIKKLCASLDRNVIAAERLGKKTKTRKFLLKRAERIRKELRRIDH